MIEARVMTLTEIGNEEWRHLVLIIFQDACLPGKGERSGRSQESRSKTKECFSVYLFLDKTDLSVLIR